MKPSQPKTMPRAALVGLLAAGSLLAGCHTDMWVQPKIKAYYESDFYTDKQASRPLVPGAVAQGTLKLDDAYYTGYASGAVVKTTPVRAVKSFASPKVMLQRGQNRFNVYCAPCHGQAGDGNGMIMQRGKGYWQKLAASYHTPYLRKIGDGHIFDVITNGHGVMYGYASRIQDVNDRWAIVNYVRALQLARNLPASELPAEARQQLEGDNKTVEPGVSPDLSPQPEISKPGQEPRQIQKGGTRGPAPSPNEGPATGARNAPATTGADRAGMGGGTR